jgi:hypothetical protein
VRDWLGDRAAVAVVAEAEAPVVVLQVTDEAKARASLASPDVHLPAGSFAVADGWATISDTKAHLDAVTGGLAQGTLADDSNFRHDADALGDAGVVSGWADLSRLSALAQHFGRSLAGSTLVGLPGVDAVPSATSTRRVALTARFTGGDAELVARTFADAPPSVPAEAGAAAAALPGDTVAALAVSGGGALAAQQWKSLQQRFGADAGDVVAAAERETGLRLPQDLVALLGRRFALAVGAPAGGSGEPVVGVRGDSDDRNLSGALDRLLQKTDSSGLPLERRDLQGGYVLATSRQEAQALATGGDLGSRNAFRDAVPGADKAFAVVYVDMERFDDVVPNPDEKSRKALSALRAVGVSVRATDDGAELTARVTTK